MLETLQDEAGDAGTSSRSNCGQARSGQGLVAWPGRRWSVSSRGQQRRAALAPMHLQLGVREALEALDEDQIDRRHPCQQRVQRRLGCAAQLVDHRPAPRRGQHHLPCAGLAMAPGVLARLVEIDLVVGVLDGRDAVAGRGQMADQPLDQRGLAVVLPADDPEDLHRTCRHHPLAAIGPAASAPSAQLAAPAAPATRRAGTDDERDGSGRARPVVPAAGAQGAQAAAGDGAGRAAARAGDRPQGAGGFPALLRGERASADRGSGRTGEVFVLVLERAA